ncbi:hypothetical protein V1264_004499 [Littorina saxatilis]|uniref:Uncharacterized protein n=1 Tax=Littorina saxatilis TaxID=31220 RepID=A0AAN9B1J5_9CAEN
METRKYPACLLNEIGVKLTMLSEYSVGNPNGQTSSHVTRQFWNAEEEEDCFLCRVDEIYNLFITNSYSAQKAVGLFKFGMCPNGHVKVWADPSSAEWFA